MKRALFGAAFFAMTLYLHFATYLMIYPDSKEYRALSRIPVTSDAFWHGIRPPVVPLFLKLSPDNHTIALLQLLLYVASSLALAAAAARWMSRGKDAAFGAMLGIAFLPQHFLWCRSISSESLTFSLLYLLLALTTVLCRPPRRQVWQIVAGAGWLITAALFVFARDANGYFLVFLCAGAILAFGLLRQRRGLLAGSAALVVALALTGICAHQATLGGRWKWPFVNLLGQRVLSRPERRAFFVERGMPVNPKVMCLAEHWGSDCHDDLSGFGGWLDGDIKGMWARYLLRHPLEAVVTPFLHLQSTLLARDPPKGMFFYFHPAPAWYRWFGSVGFEWHLTLALLVAAFLAGAWRVGWRKLLPAWVLIAAVWPMLFFAWNADAAEWMRHSVLAATSLRLGLVLGVLIWLDRPQQTA